MTVRPMLESKKVSSDMSHLESLIAEYLEWQGFLIRRNVKVRRRVRGGWDMGLDVVGFHPHSGSLVHYEPSIDALSWEQRAQANEAFGVRRYPLVCVW